MDGGAADPPRHVTPPDAPGGTVASPSAGFVTRAQPPLRAMVLVLALSLPAHAQLSSNAVRFTPAVQVFVNNADLPDHAVAGAGNGAAGILVAPPLPDPGRIRIDAFSFFSPTQYAFSVDVPFRYQGVNYQPADLIGTTIGSTNLWMFWNSTSYFVDLSANLDAVAFLPGSTNFLFSTDAQFSFGASFPTHRSDILQWDWASETVSNRYSHDLLGLPGNANLDALHAEPGHVYFSLDVPWTSSGAGSATAGDAWDYNGITLAALDLPGLDPLDVAALDAPTDTDGDGLTDLEETALIDEPSTPFPGHSAPLVPTYVSDPTRADTDGDGVGDRDEAAARTDPYNDLDYLRIVRLDSLVSGRYVVWTSIPGVSYDVETATMIDGFPLVVTNNLVADGTLTGYLDAQQPGSGLRLFRISVNP